MRALLCAFLLCCCNKQEPTYTKYSQPEKSKQSVEAHQLKHNISWKFDSYVDQKIRVRSVEALDRFEIKTIKRVTKNTIDAFLEYYNVKCDLGPLEMRIVTLDQLNSPKYFYWINRNTLVYGRFFGVNNVIYFTIDSLYDTYVLRHELTHYMYDECNMLFEEKEEHQRIDEFLEWKGQNK